MSIICPACGAEIGLVPVVKHAPKGDTNYEGVQKKFAQAGLASKQFPCRYQCGVMLKWKMPYTKGDHPVELNGQEHNCPNVNKQ